VTKRALDLDQLRVMRVAEVSQLLGVDRRTVARWQHDGRFPVRREIGPGVAGWLARDVARWLESRPPAKGGPKS
jgi:predicted DNA-binding transcriptional regulator AlpA